MTPVPEETYGMLSLPSFVSCQLGSKSTGPPSCYPRVKRSLKRVSRKPQDGKEEGGLSSPQKLADALRGLHCRAKPPPARRDEHIKNLQAFGETNSVLSENSVVRPEGIGNLSHPGSENSLAGQLEANKDT